MKKNKLYELINTNTLLIILIAAFIIRIVFFAAFQPWEKDVVQNSILLDDAIQYNNLALSLLDTLSFEKFDAFRTPGYPVFVAILYFISSGSVWFVLLIQVILSTLSVLLVYKIALLIFSEKAALLAALLFAIDPIQVTSSIELYTETLFVFLFLASVYYLCRSIKMHNLSGLCISAVILGAATLIRPISYLLPFIVIIYILLFSNYKIKMRLGYSFLFSIVFIAAISPWLLHNYSKYGVAKLSSITGYNLLFYNVASTESFKTGKSFDFVTKEFNDLASQKGADQKDWVSFKNSRIFTNIAEQYIKDNFFLYCKRNLTGIFYMYCSTPSRKILSDFHLESKADNLRKYDVKFQYSEIFRQMSFLGLAITIFVLIFMLLNYLFSIKGILLGIEKKENLVYLFIFLIIYFSVLTGVVGGSRYRLPIMPFINIFCSAGLVYYYGSRKSKKVKGER